MALSSKAWSQLLCTRRVANHRRFIPLAGMRLLSPLTERQAFSLESHLDTMPAERKDVSALAACAAAGKFLLVAQGKVLLNGGRAKWLSWSELESLRVIDLTEPILLGRLRAPYGSLSAAHDSTCHFALDVSASAAALQASGLPPDSSWSGLREIVSGELKCSPDELSLAGRALSLVNWHASCRFCGRCGAPTNPIEGGAKRACSATAQHRFYPRTDPVSIMVVESTCGKRVLLGRYHRSPPGMFTALAGFIEQCESVEAAVRREVKEESNLDVGAVQILGSQPWPIGRAGSCELMIACVARALDDTQPIVCEEAEMAEIRWFELSEAKAALAESLKGAGAAPAAPAAAEAAAGDVEAVVRTPGPNAVAHHLIAAWVEEKTRLSSSL